MAESYFPYHGARFFVTQRLSVMFLKYFLHYFRLESFI